MKASEVYVKVRLAFTMSVGEGTTADEQAHNAIKFFSSWMQQSNIKPIRMHIDTSPEPVIENPLTAATLQYAQRNAAGSFGEQVLPIVPNGPKVTEEEIASFNRDIDEFVSKRSTKQYPPDSFGGSDYPDPHPKPISDDDQPF